MAQKKSGKPIRITLTEEQISDIIQSAAKTRRSLSAQSLEDRIAPSAIGAPMFDPSLGDPPPDGYSPVPTHNGGDGGGALPPDGAPAPIDPNGPDAGGIHFGPGQNGGHSGPVGAPDPTSDDPGSYTAPTPPSGPLVGGSGPDHGLPPIPGSSDNVNSGLPNPSELQGGNLPPIPGSDTYGDVLHHQPTLLHGSNLPPVPGGGLDANAGNPNPGDAGAGVGDGGTPSLPNPQEMEEHRRNLLRQLRGL